MGCQGGGGRRVGSVVGAGLCQAPGFVEALLVGSGGGRLWLFLVVGVGDPGGLVLGRGAHADGAVGAHRVVPVDPLKVIQRASACISGKRYYDGPPS